MAGVSPLAKLDFSNWPLAKSFDLVLELAAADPRLRPGMSANARVAVERTAGRRARCPAQALFQKAGRTVVYVQGAWGFEERVGRDRPPDPEAGRGRPRRDGGRARRAARPHDEGGAP